MGGGSKQRGGENAALAAFAIIVPAGRAFSIIICILCVCVGFRILTRQLLPFNIVFVSNVENEAEYNFMGSCNSFNRGSLKIVDAFRKVYNAMI